MIVFAITFENDQAGPMWHECILVNNIADVVDIQNTYTNYTLYKTELSFTEASNICGKNTDERDFCQYGIFYVYVDDNPYCSDWEEDERNERMEVSKILMKNIANPQLTSNKDVKSFSDVTNDEWVSLKSCNMLTKFYPFTIGDTYQRDVDRFIHLYEKTKKQNGTQKQLPKLLVELSENEYNTLYQVGMLWVCYPEATGNWKNDTVPVLSNVIIKPQITNGTMINVGMKDTFSIDNFQTQLSKISLDVSFNSVTGDISDVTVKGHNCGK